MEEKKAPTQPDYAHMDNPYDSLIQRQDTIFGIGQVNNGNALSEPSDAEDNSLGGSSVINDSFDTSPESLRGDAMNNLIITNWIKSRTYQPKKAGFYIDGGTGYAEFMNVYISGNVNATTGTIGGWTINATSLSATSGGNTTILSSGSTAFTAGPTGSPTITITQAGVLTATGGTITGGTIQTATSGKRIVILGSNNSLTLFNSSGSDILDFGSQSSVIMRILPTDTDTSGLVLQNASGLVLTNNLFSADVQNASSTANAISGSNVGTGAAGTFVHTGNGKTVVITKSSVVGTALEINQNVNGRGLLLNNAGTNHGIEIVQSGDGVAFYSNTTHTTTTNSVNTLINAGLGRTLEIQQNNVSNANNALYIVSAGSSASIFISTGVATSTNFFKTADWNGKVIYVGNGVTPNGNLSGSQGDVCIGADSGKAYYCSGSTTWVAF